MDFPILASLVIDQPGPLWLAPVARVDASLLRQGTPDLRHGNICGGIFRDNTFPEQISEETTEAR